MDDFLNLLKGQATQLDQVWAHPRIAVVTSVDPTTFTVRVTIQPEAVLSGWLPVASAWVGNGWGLACPPQPGDQVIVLWQEGDAEQGVVVGRLWSNHVVPPAAPAGECWLVHSSGSYIKLHNSGAIESNAGTWVHHGNLQVTGNVSDFHGSLDALRGHYNEHTHLPSTTPPTPTD
jgi:phage baseplate assembly protein V